MKSNLTDFQWRVLRMVQKIPFGQTRSYQWVAKKIGKPKAARAVGQALNKNPYAPMIPCYCVVCSDGSLGGYAGGIRLKKFLLNTEKEVLNQSFRRF